MTLRCRPVKLLFPADVAVACLFRLGCVSSVKRICPRHLGEKGDTNTHAHIAPWLKRLEHDVENCSEVVKQ